MRIYGGTWFRKQRHIPSTHLSPIWLFRSRANFLRDAGANNQVKANMKFSGHVFGKVFPRRDMPGHATIYCSAVRLWSACVGHIIRFFAERFFRGSSDQTPTWPMKTTLILSFKDICLKISKMNDLSKSTITTLAKKNVCFCGKLIIQESYPETYIPSPSSIRSD